MPTYEYVCEKCDKTFEVFQPITDEPLKVCPKDHCGQKRWGKGKVKRAIGGGAGLIFKGSGFYITDYRSDSYKQSAKTDVPAAAPPATPAKTEGAAPPKSPSKPSTKKD
jgi:putative FmdB family regulatory protein